MSAMERSRRTALRSGRDPHRGGAAAGRRGGFTLVELLVVIAIIALLMALLFPAVQSVREAARVSQCRNQVKQIATGCLTHLETQGFWPSGGWGYMWTGEADRGFGKSQPGGWSYSVLPYIEQTAVHQMGAGLTDATQREAANSRRAGTPVPTFYCPSRRPPLAILAAVNMINAPRPAAYAKTDYGMNIGDVQVGGGCLPAGPPKTCLTDYPVGSCINSGAWPGANADNWYGTTCNPANFNGLSTHRSEMPASEVVDGMSTTLLVAEKNLNPDRYLFGTCGADNGDAWQGRDWDTSRWTADTPVPDTRGIDQIQRFGGPHAAGVVAAACDGAVRVVTFRVEQALWRRLGNCQDTSGTSVQITDWPGR